MTQRAQRLVALDVLLASLPMYSAQRAAVVALWDGLAGQLRAARVADVPHLLTWPDDLALHWTSPKLLLIPICNQ